MKILYGILALLWSSFAVYADSMGSTCAALHPKKVYEEILDQGFETMLLSHIDKEELIARAAKTKLTKPQLLLFNQAVEVTLSQLDKEKLHLVKTESISYHNTLASSTEAKMFLSYNRFDTSGHRITLYIDLATCKVVDFIFGFYQKVASEEVRKAAALQ